MKLPPFLLNGNAELLLGGLTLSGAFAYYNFSPSKDETLSSVAAEYRQSQRSEQHKHGSLVASTKTAPLFPCKISAIPGGIGFDGPLSFPEPRMGEQVDVVETNVGPHGAYYAVVGKGGRAGMWPRRMLDCKGGDGEGKN
ncbi:hypothetical protein TeGR_g4387 [Tetraparma gracilis]|jgi:hypothetical protein|uniref:Uncharacterized protein n=1 Tax=Tetraparma gracilis TaxID=2962635 RepID=A0ABQ6MFZ0_9STRA|nr:hypothetical protein TeGR_g4387 [Tetraparma gracilis]